MRGCRLTAARPAAVALLAALALPALLALPPAPQSLAARGLELVTPYPSISVTAGNVVTLDVQVITPTRRQVDLEVTHAPPGWQTALRGGGFVVTGVFGGPHNPPNQRAPEVQLEVRVPPDAGVGENSVVLRATSQGVSEVLDVHVLVSQTAAGAVSLTAEFPTLRGRSDTTFTFRAKVQNHTGEQATLALSAEGPDGWKLDPRPQAEARAATVSVEGGSESTVELETDPPDDVPAGEYPILLRAAGAGAAAEVSFTVEITGNVKMTLTTATQRLDTTAAAGRATTVALAVRNEGTAPLRSVTFSQSPPAGWDVSFQPETVGSILPGRSARVTATVTPAADAVAGDYSLTLTATSESWTSNAELRVQIRAGRLPGAFGLLVIGGIAYGVYRVFQRYGRR